jgi:putative membrane protein insertion efficiency factor
MTNGGKLAQIPTRLALAFIRIYQLTFSSLLGPKCRFEPSCSCYTAICIERFGLLRGAWLGLRRILRCHPFGPWGYDPPPEVQGSPTLPSAQLFRKSFK